MKTSRSSSNPSSSPVSKGRTLTGGGANLLIAKGVFVAPSLFVAPVLVATLLMPLTAAAEEPMKLEGMVRFRDVPHLESKDNRERALETLSNNQKHSNKQKLSASQYRSLGVGCIGLEWSYMSPSAPAKITAVYSGSPAAKAGIRAGDEIYEGNRDDKNIPKAKDPTPTHFTLAREGTEQEITILRNGEPIKFTLVRVNIEDIPDHKARTKWERVISSLGVPEDGFYAGSDIHNLKLTQKAAQPDN